MLKAIFFDLDGTLFFTRKANFLAYQKAFLTFGVNLTEEEYKKWLKR
jgi:beta-phosphoglucomutase-like phosphatase (HAD superfamily)